MDPILKLFLLKKVLVGPMINTHDSHKKHRHMSTFLFNAIQTCTNTNLKI